MAWSEGHWRMLKRRSNWDMRGGTDNDINHHAQGLEAGGAHP